MEVFRPGAKFLSFDDMPEKDIYPVLDDISRFPYPNPVVDAQGNRYIVSQELDKKREERAGIQLAELKDKYTEGALKDKLVLYHLMGENAEIIRPVREKISRHIDISDIADFEEKITEMRALEAEAVKLNEESLKRQELKEKLIEEDTRYWKERIESAVHTDAPGNPLKALIWFFSSAGRGRANAWQKILQGIAEVKKSQEHLDKLYQQREEIAGVEGNYGCDLHELSLLWEMIRKLYGKTGRYQGTLRRMPKSFFGMHIESGAELYSPDIHLETSYAGDEMAEHLNSLEKADEQKLDPAQIPALKLHFGDGVLSYGAEAPYLTKEQRELLLALVSSEEQAWGGNLREGVVQNIHRHKIAASWTLMRRYVEFLLERIEGRETVMQKTTGDLANLLEEVNQHIHQLEKYINGPNLMELLDEDGKKVTYSYRISKDMIKQFRTFMEILGDCPLVRSMYSFVQNQALIVKSSNRDSILEPFAHDYEKQYVDGDVENVADQRARNLTEQWRKGGDFVKWKDSRRYRESMRNYRGETVYCNLDGLYSTGEHINPKVFYDGTVRDRVVLRVLDELVKGDTPHFQSAMFWGSAQQGNVLRCDDFAEALARKMWEMEKKWSALSDENRRRWLGAHAGWTHHLTPDGVVANVVRLAAYDKYSD